jgi:hypothetical protein
MRASAEVVEDGWVWRHLKEVCLNEKDREFPVEKIISICEPKAGGRKRVTQ